MFMSVMAFDVVIFRHWNGSVRRWLFLFGLRERDFLFRTWNASLVFERCLRIRTVGSFNNDLKRLSAVLRQIYGALVMSSELLINNGSHSYTRTSTQRVGATISTGSLICVWYIHGRPSRSQRSRWMSIHCATCQGLMPGKTSFVFLRS